MKIAAFFENIAEGAMHSGISLEQALHQLHELGMDAVYISYEALSRYRERLLELFADIGLEVEGLHGHFDLGADPEDARCLDMIRLAKESGARNVLIVPGMILPEQAERREELLGNMVAGLRRAVALGAQLGIDVSMEDFDGPDAPYNCLAGLQWFLDQVPGLKCSFDTGNFVMLQEDEVAAFHHLRGDICTMHIKDRVKAPIHPEDNGKYCADGTAVYAAPVGSGYIRIGQILNVLRQDGYDGNIIAELFEYSDMMEGLRQSVSWLRKWLEENGGGQDA